MRFSNSIFIYFLIFIPLLVFFLIVSWKKKQKLLETFGNMKLMEKLTSSVNFSNQKIKQFLMVCAMVLLILAVSGPQIGTRMVEVKRQGVDIIIAVDTSQSMQAQDIKPTRLEKAKMELNTLINRLEGDRIGIIAFAGMAFLQCPLTLDYNAAKMFLDVLDVNLIPYPGTELGKAIELAIKSFSRKERKYKALILLTDGEDHSKGLSSVVSEAKKEGIRIYTIGIGSPEGEPIPIYDSNNNLTGYKKDKKGAVVMSKLDEGTLRELALKTGGKYYLATRSEFEIDKIYENISKMDKKNLQSKLASQYEDRYQYFVILILILLIVEFLIPDSSNKEAQNV